METLSKGIFWVICAFAENDEGVHVDLDDFRLLYFSVPCSPGGYVDETQSLKANSKKGNSFNHKITWECGLFANREFAPLARQRPYNYYPRGRVEIANGKGTIYLNGNINAPQVIDRVQNSFGLTHSLKSVRVVVDNSRHYHCYADGLDDW